MPPKPRARAQNKRQLLLHTKAASSKRKRRLFRFLNAVLRVEKRTVKTAKGHSYTQSGLIDDFYNLLWRDITKFQEPLSERPALHLWKGLPDTFRELQHCAESVPLAEHWLLASLSS